MSVRLGMSFVKKVSARKAANPRRGKARMRKPRENFPARQPRPARRDWLWAAGGVRCFLGQKKFVFCVDFAREGKFFALLST
jgi:hypothetical protein